MSTRTLFILNSGLLLLLGSLYILVGSRDFWAFVLGFGCVLLLAIGANGFMLFKALWRREYLLAMGYLVLVIGAVVVLCFLPAPHKIGG